MLAEMFNSYYINIAEKNTWKKASHFARDLIVQLYLDHSSIKTTSKNQIPSITSSTNACGTNPEEILELLSALDIKKLLLLI